MVYVHMSISSPCAENTFKVRLVQLIRRHNHHPLTTLTPTLCHHLHTLSHDLTNKVCIIFGQLLI